MNAGKGAGHASNGAGRAAVALSPCVDLDGCAGGDVDFRDRCANLVQLAANSLAGDHRWMWPAPWDRRDDESGGVL